jgi:curved DNA-binding protein
LRCFSGNVIRTEILAKTRFMEFKDYYKTMGVTKDATPEDIKRAHRKLARKYHPDVSKEKNAEAQFKDLAEAYEVLRDPERRAAYDEFGANYKAGQEFRPPPEWASRQSAGGADFDTGEGADHSAFFEELLRGMGGMGGAGRTGARRGGQADFDMHGEDQHARIQINIEDAYSGAARSLQLRIPDAETGRLQDRTIEFSIPKGIRAGQHIRLAAQGAPGMGRGSPGDLYLDVEFLPHRLYRVDKLDVYMDLPVSPWEAALGAEVEAPTPTGRVEVKIPPGSVSGRKLRLKGRGLPAKAPGDFYFVLHLAVPVAANEAEKKAYADMAAAFKTFDPRAHLKELEGQA